MGQFSINGKIIKDDTPTFIIAEACDNHLGSVESAKEMVRLSKLAGADAIKFQHHIPDEEMLADIPLSDNFEEPLYEFLQKYALTIEQHKEIKKYCDSVNIDYLCTPFSYKAALELDKIGLKTFKIGSGEMTDIVSLEKIARIGHPLILSTGMCDLREIHETCDKLKEWGANFALLNCISEYPPSYNDINLKVINILQEEFPDTIIGHSDHTPDLYTSFAAVALGAKIIEKHVTLDKRIPGPDQSVSIDMSDLAELVEGIRKIESALGSVKCVHPREKEIRKWAFRSIVSVRDIPANTVLTEDLLVTKRPGTGIPSKELQNIIGKKARKFIPANTLVRYEDLEM